MTTSIASHPGTSTISRLLRFVRLASACLALMLIFGNSASARTCGDFKSVALADIQNQMQSSCRDVTGKNVTPKKKKAIMALLEETWDSNYTFQCMQSCGADAQCVDKIINDFVTSAMNALTPQITPEWCQL